MESPCYSPGWALKLRRNRALTMKTLVGACLVLLLLPLAASGQIVLADVDGQQVRPLQVSAEVAATVVVFASIECPISNRYAPVVERLRASFATKGVRFYLVYPNPAESSSAIRAHVAEYGYKLRALIDPTHVLVKAADVSVTPEAAVFDGHGALVYRGRIDDRFVSLGVERPAPTTHDLADAISATLAGKRVAQPRTQAVGCFVSDFLR